MTYAVQQDLIDRFGQTELLDLTDRNNTGSIDATVVSRALTDADGEINGYLTGRYTLPLSTVPGVIKRLACDMARYYLFDIKATDQVLQRYKDAIKFLQSIAAGTASLGVDAGSLAAVATGGVEIKANDRVFNQETLGDYAGS